MIIETYHSFLLSEGTYIIGDPQLFVPSSGWIQCLFQSSNFKNPAATFIDEMANLNFVIAFASQFGEGIFKDNSNKEYKCYSSFFGIMDWDVNKQVPAWCNVVEFTEPFKVVDHNGVLKFGNISIDTLESFTNKRLSEELFT